ncbi:hypothetical protein [Vibrio sp. SCSIO 43136]|uniref:hypothetical protein n=1 Tax=Vibrio sp. SCSIO 43136 TaxID=2819101 RepID=UPI0020751E1A|nr:hypothetical protein [Vibrio sp. SCSIO 43136]USD66372.1 30S ribosomal protein S6 modification protein [Vibrio sp. SCSIO 43136]
MITRTMIKVWYGVSGEKVLLGESHSGKSSDLVSMWVKIPTSGLETPHGGYRMSLFDDDGHMMGDKPISRNDAEFLLDNTAFLGSRCSPQDLAS